MEMYLKNVTLIVSVQSDTPYTEANVTLRLLPEIIYSASSPEGKLFTPKHLPGSLEPNKILFFENRVLPFLENRGIIKLIEYIRLHTLPCGKH